MMAKNRESLDITSERLKSSGGGLGRVAENKPLTTPKVAPPNPLLEREDTGRLKPLRTMGSDAASHIKDEHITQTQIALAEQTKREAAKKPSAKKSVSVGLIFLVAGLLVALGTLGYIYLTPTAVTPLLRPGAPTITPTQARYPSVFPDNLPLTQTRIESDFVTAIETREALQAAALGEGYHEFIFGPTVDGKFVKMPFADFVNDLRWSFDPITLLGITDYSYGVEVTGSSESPFLIITTTDPEQLRAFFYEWEMTAFSESTDTLHLNNSAVEEPSARYADIVLAGEDARVQADGLGYSFVNDTTVIVSPSRTLLTNLITAFD